jgi:hypothetical protein
LTLSGEICSLGQNHTYTSIDGAYTVLIRCIYSAYMVYIQCIYGVYTVHMRCIYTNFCRAFINYTTV